MVGTLVLGGVVLVAGFAWLVLRKLRRAHSADQKDNSDHGFTGLYSSTDDSLVNRGGDYVDACTGGDSAAGGGCDSGSGGGD